MDNPAREMYEKIQLKNQEYIREHSPFKMLPDAEELKRSIENDSFFGVRLKDLSKEELLVFIGWLRRAVFQFSKSLGGDK